MNAAGLGAAELAGSIRGFPTQLVPRVRLAKGHYFVLQGQSPFERLIYPMPVDGGLGVHVTLDTQGTARFGPDVAWVDSIDYRFEGGVKRHSWRPPVATGPDLTPAGCRKATQASGRS